MKVNRTRIGVIGGRRASARQLEFAEAVGGEIARLGALLVCGGLGGVMEAACRGAKKAGGLTMGILPGKKKDEANRFVDFPVATGLGLARNIMVVQNSDFLVAVAGSYGTLSEISFALQYGLPVIGLESWDIPGMIKARGLEDCLEKIKSFHQRSKKRA